MIVKERWRIDQLIRSAKSRNPQPTFIARLRLRMADPKFHKGGDRYVLAAVYPQDGRAIVVPATSQY